MTKPHRNMSPNSGISLIPLHSHFLVFCSHPFKEILIFDCVFGEKAHDCRGGEIDGIYYSLWEPVTTFFGKCLRFSTENLQFVYPKGLRFHIHWPFSIVGKKFLRNPWKIASKRDTKKFKWALSQDTMILIGLKDGRQCLTGFHSL